MSRAKNPARRQPRDEGLLLAIRAAGGIKPLAFALGITHPALREWGRVPDHRVLQVEEVTGIPREQLRPDLYGEQAQRKQIERELDAVYAAARFLVNAMARVTALIDDKRPDHPKMADITAILDQLTVTVQQFNEKIK